MTRSRKKNPFTGITCIESEKFDKQKSNRKLRRLVNILLTKGEEIFPSLREVSNRWTFGKDGKQRWLDERCIRK